MSEKSKKLYEDLKTKINRLREQGTKEKQFVDFWRLACTAKYKSHDMRYLYDDTSREFIEKHRNQLIKIREDFVENLDYYVEKCIERMRQTNKFRVYYAKTNEEAHKMFMEELGDETKIYKSVSNEAKDIGLIEFLNKNEIEIKETAIGDILARLLDYKLPTYQLGSSVHFSVEEIVAKIKKEYNVDIEPKSEAILKYYRDNYRPEIVNNVKVSLTSANAIAADDGSIFIGENTGNISLITRLAEKHIVAVGITKIVPTSFDAFLVTKTLSRINKTSMAYLSIISAPSNTSSIQGKTTQGAFGARDVVVIFVDEWRRNAVEKNLIYKDFLKCISCKSCSFVCTASRAFGNIFASKYGLGATAIIREYIHNGIEAAVNSGLFLCTGCDNCYKWCPVGVNLREIMTNIKKEAIEKDLCPPPLMDYRKNILVNKNPFK
ncbi:MAG: LUD domain-containing protein [Candidatus Hodarchaeota archaeon]